MEEKKIPEPLFIVDSSVLVKIFEGDTTDNELLLKISEMKKLGMPFKAITTISSFMRALWKANNNVTIEKVHSVMDLLDIGESRTLGFSCPNYKNKEAVMREIIDVAKMLSGDEKVNVRKVN